MRIQVLGPLRVWRGDVELEPGAAGQRTVLALLAVANGQPVPRAELVTALWGERPRASATNMIQTYVKHLRRLLEPERPPRTRCSAISTAGDGYLLNLPGEQVDLMRFRHLLGDAEVNRRAGDRTRAAALLGEAVGLWHGPPLTNVPQLAGHPKLVGLVSEHRAAVIRYGEAMLGIGAVADALPVLVEAAAAQPLDELGHALLIRCYHAAGRRMQAFTTYEQIRRRLADDLGVGPGPELVAAHAALLRDDVPPAATRTAAPAGAPVVVPRQLLAPPPFFTGREAELAALDALLAGGGRSVPTSMPVAVVGGVGGVGKTWLALHWAHRRLDLFPDGQLHVNLRGFDPSRRPVPPEVAIGGFLDALGVDPAAAPTDQDARAALYRSLVAGRRLLIVLDNAADPAQVTPLLPGTPTCAVLVTSRRRLTTLVATHGARPVQLDALTEPQARELLARRLGADRLAAEPRVVAELQRYCAGLPLALGIVAARATAHPSFPLGALVEELRDHTGRLDALDSADTGLRAVLSWSREALPPAAAVMFGLLGIAPGPDIGAPAAAALAAVPPVRARALLRDLDDANLVQRYAPDRYRMHDLVRLYAADEVARRRPDAGRTAALRRLVDFYLHTAFAAERQLDTHRPPIQLADPAPGCRPQPPGEGGALDWFTTEHANLLAAQRLAADHGWHTQVWQLAWTLQTFHWRRGHHLHDDLTAWRVGLVAADRLADPAVQCLVRRRLGGAYSRAGQHSAALTHLRSALLLAERTGDPAGRAHTHQALAWAWEEHDDHRRALEHSTHALRLFRTLDLPVWQARALNAMGRHETRLGHHARAHAHCVSALALARRHGYPEGEARTLESLGQLAHLTGRLAQARAYYQRALAVLRELGDTYQEAGILDRLAHTHQAAGRPDQAAATWRLALDLYLVQHRRADITRVRNHLTAHPVPVT